jgi:hypothetical protein
MTRAVSVEHNTILVIRADGTESVVPMLKGTPPTEQAALLIGADMLDFVRIGLLEGTDLVMAVDDNGWEYEVVQHNEQHFEHRAIKARKPINQRATELYHEICKPGTTHQIVGDVAIMHDGDVP